jgi:hypothetical protein
MVPYIAGAVVVKAIIKGNVDMDTLKTLKFHK